MLTVQSTSPQPALRPFIRAYVQRHAHLGSEALVEPVQLSPAPAWRVTD
jgi:hypothetical protein